MAGCAFVKAFARDHLPAHSSYRARTVPITESLGDNAGQR
jgi:hypothetical protein